MLADETAGVARVPTVDPLQEERKSLIRRVQEIDQIDFQPGVPAPVGLPRALGPDASAQDRLLARQKRFTCYELQQRLATLSGSPH